MSSQGTGADITADEAKDLLHKLVTEFKKVHAVFISGAGITASISGLVKTSPNGDFFVRDRPEFGSPLIGFSVEAASSRKYGDSRAFGGGPEIPGIRFASALVFLFPDGAQLALFEIEESRR